MLIFVCTLVFLALLAIILGFTTNWYTDWSRYGVDNTQQEEQLPEGQDPAADEENQDPATEDETGNASGTAQRSVNNPESKFMISLLLQ